MEVGETAGDLCRVEDNSLVIQTCVANVVDVEAQVSSVHQGEHHAQRVLRLVGIGKAHLGGGGGRGEKTSI